MSNLDTAMLANALRITIHWLAAARQRWAEGPSVCTPWLGSLQRVATILIPYQVTMQKLLRLRKAVSKIFNMFLNRHIFRVVSHRFFPIPYFC